MRCVAASASRKKDGDGIAIVDIGAYER